jgi:hypothetical protein
MEKLRRKSGECRFAFSEVNAAAAISGPLLPFPASVFPEKGQGTTVFLQS